MLNKFDDKSQKIIALSESIAFDFSVSDIGTEHLLLAFLKVKDNKLRTLLEKESVTFESIKSDILALFGKKNQKPYFMEYQESLKKVLENAIVIAKKSKFEKVNEDILALSLLEAKDTVAIELLNKYISSTKKIIDELKIQTKNTSELDNIIELNNLNQKTLKKEPILVHREKEVDSLIQVLLRKQKSNAVIIGQPGVGKTAIVEYLAHLINKGEVPTVLKNKVIYELDIPSLIAGTKYRGEFEEKLKKVLKKVKENKHAIIFIDEIHNIVGAGGAEGAIDASNIIKPYLSRGDVCCIGATTYDEYIKLFEKEQALERRFQIVRLEEPSISQTIDILLAIKEGFEKYHKIKIQDETIKDLAKLCSLYVFDRHFPDKAIDVLDIACVKCKTSGLKTLTTEIIINTIEDNHNVKIQIKDKASVLKESLNKELVGQKKAIKSICNHIRYIELGLNDTNRPLGVFMFVGATGVGKTETSKQIAKYYFGSERKYVKLNMAEYNDSASVTKLLGSAPGYIGHEKQSLLVDHIRNHPHSVVVLDEVEKAHRDVMDIFLNVFDEGYFYDANKRKIDFTNSIIILTSNLGFSEGLFHQGKVGFVDNAFDNRDIQKEINKHFRPEFLNRIDEIIMYETLDEDACIKLIENYVREYQGKVDFELPLGDIIDKVLSDSEASRYGARGIRRKVKKEILRQIENKVVYKA